MCQKMRLLHVAVCMAVAVVCGLAAGGPAVDELPIRRVILYKHGVGYFERIGTVQGDAQVNLRFKAKDMSDLLKSLTVLDLGGGTIRTVAYDSTKTVDQQLAEYTFDLRKTRSLHAILEQMKGGEVTLQVDGRKLSGRVLAVERRLERMPPNVQVERYRLSLLMAGATVKSYDLADVSDLQFTDPTLQGELQKYLEVLFSRHRRDEKRVEVLTSGKGKRDLFASYVLEQPVWKVSYRIVTGKMQKPLLQAWAIVDNVSGNDWEDVELSLVSGLPVSFRQNLYDPFYVARREIKLQRESVVGPVVHAPGERLQEEAKRLAYSGALGKAAAPRRSGMKGFAADAVAAEAAPAMARAPRPDMLAGMSRQAAQAVAQEAGALFVYKIDRPVTIKRDRSALLPIANTRVDGERVAIYNERTRRDNPMAGIRIKNTTGLTLEGGPITVIEENTYAGEALINTMKADEERYISFAVDLGTRVNPKRGGSKQDVYLVKIVNGVMYTHFKQQETKVYHLNNLEDKPKTVVIEHPVRRDWQLVDTAKPREVTPEVYRFEEKLGAKKKLAFTVIEEKPGQTTWSLSDLNRPRILFFLRQKYIDAATRAFLEKVVALQSEIRNLKSGLDGLKSESTRIFSDQQRLRANLKSLGRSESEKSYRNRIVQQLNQQEDRIQAMIAQVKEHELSLRQKERELAKMIGGFKFEKKL